jgi:hypothetical protein
MSAKIPASTVCPPPLAGGVKGGVHKKFALYSKNQYTMIRAVGFSILSVEIRNMIWPFSKKKSVQEKEKLKLTCLRLLAADTQKYIEDTALGKPTSNAHIEALVSSFGNPKVIAEEQVKFLEERKKQDKLARLLIAVGKSLEVKCARDAASMTMGRDVTDTEWEKIREVWERNWDTEPSA